MSDYQQELQALEAWYAQECALVREAYLPPDLPDVWHSPGKVKLEKLEVQFTKKLWELQEKYGIETE